MYAETSKEAVNQPDQRAYPGLEVYHKVYRWGEVEQVLPNKVFVRFRNPTNMDVGVRWYSKSGFNTLTAIYTKKDKRRILRAESREAKRIRKIEQQIKQFLQEVEIIGER